MKPMLRPAMRRQRQAGTVAMSIAVSLPVILGLMGVAIDLSLLFLRNTELQQLADATAAAAAAELDGTAAGVTRARDKAQEIAALMTYGGPYQPLPRVKFDNGQAWSANALFVSRNSLGPWTRIDNVAATDVPNLAYARVDTAELASLPRNPGYVSTNVLSHLLHVRNSNTVAPASVAGRVAMHITPLGVCALSNTKFQQRQAELLPPATTMIAAELVEFGFRRGITYDLRNLNPAGSSGRAFLVNPIDAGDQTVHAAHFTALFVKSFFCSGTIAYGTLRPNASVHVKAIDLAIAPWLNSRFDDYSSVDACVNRDGAPPDTNVKEFTAPYQWMASGTTLPAAKSTVVAGTNGARVTIADINWKVHGEPANNNEAVTAEKFGPLWVFSKPVRYVDGSTGAGANPQVFTTGNWPTLYQVGSGATTVSSTTTPSSSAYPPSGTPYTYYAGTPPSAGYKHPFRRVLNVPLLDCMSTISNTATVLGVGLFFMTSKATDTAVYGEFAGLADPKLLTAAVSRLQ